MQNDLIPNRLPADEPGNMLDGDYEGRALCPEHRPADQVYGVIILLFYKGVPNENLTYFRG